MKRRRKNLWEKEANLAGQSAAGVLAWTGTCMWTKQTANGGRDMGKQVRKSAETAHSRMRGDWRPEKHISVQTGRGRDSVHVCERERVDVGCEPGVAVRCLLLCVGVWQDGAWAVRSCMLREPRGEGRRC